MSGYERENRNVLRRCLKTASERAACLRLAAWRCLPARKKRSISQMTKSIIWETSCSVASYATES